MNYCVPCGWKASTKKQQRRSCPHCGGRTSALLFNRILDPDNNILYEGIDKEQADILWDLAKHNDPLVKRIEYAC